MKRKCYLKVTSYVFKDASFSFIKMALNLKEVESLVFSNMSKECIAHTKSVVNYAMTIARAECPEFMDDVLLAAYMHDICGMDESREHAINGAMACEGILKNFFPNTNHRKIMHAIRYHSDERITKDKLIGTLWDAEKLARKKNNIDLFCTAKGIELAMFNEAF